MTRTSSSILPFLTGNTAHPSISVWELREARRRLKRRGQKAVNEDLIFDAYNRLRALEEEAVRETKKTRRSAQRRQLHAHARIPRTFDARIPT